MNEEEQKEAFALFDKKANGTVSSKDVPDLLRAVGQNPTLHELQEIEAQNYPKGEKALTWDEYKKIQQRPDGFKAKGSAEEFITAFSIFDRDGNGTISAGELRYVLTSLGERLTDRQVDELLRVVTTDKEGAVNYSDFVKAIMSG